MSDAVSGRSTHHPAAQLYEPDPSGFYRRPLVETPRIRSYMIGFGPGEVVDRHAHLESDELFVVMAGSALFTVEGRREVGVAAGDALVVPAGAMHGLVVGDDGLTLLAVVAPNVNDGVNE